MAKKNAHAVALGRLGGNAGTAAQLEARRRNALKAGGRRPRYRCACGATGRDLARWKTAAGEERYRCRSCGAGGAADDIACE